MSAQPARMRCGAAVIACCMLSVPALAGDAGKTPKTVITGEQMEIGNKGQTVTFSGGARVVNGTSELTAQRIVQDKQNDQVDAYGDVDFRTRTQAGEPLRGTAQRGVYSPRTRTGALSEGRATVVYEPATSTGPLTMTADRIAFDETREELAAAGRVEIITSSACAYGPNATFHQKERMVVMTKADVQPELVYTDPAQPARYKADRITAYTERKHVYLEGRVAGKVRMKEEPPATGK